MREPFITFENVSKQFKMPYGVISPLKNVDFCINSGEMTAIMGVSGSGKTTLLGLLGFLDSATSGRYLFKGLKISGLSDDEMSRIRRDEVAFIFQDFQLISEMTVLENVLMPFRYKKTGKGEAMEKALKSLEKVKLSHRLNHYPHEISGGEAQRTAFARAIAASPALILADEPTGNLDSKTASMILELLFMQNKEGSTIIVVTHDEQISKRFPRIIRLFEGEIVDEIFQ